MKKENTKWEDKLFDGRFITTILIFLMAFIILISQSFAISTNLSMSIMFKSILNHNMIYIFLLVYFILLKTSFGKKYFNYLNIFVIVLYLVESISSFLTLFQAFTLSSLLVFLINVVLFLYLFHTMLRGTRVWKDYKLKHSPFNEITNDYYYDFLFIVPSVLLLVNFIGSTSVNGCIIAFLDYLFILLFSRYIYIYREFLDTKKIDINNDGNFDEIRKNVSDTYEDIKDGTVKLIDDVNDGLNDIAKDMKDDFNKFIKDNEIDKKVDTVKDNVISGTKKIKENVDEFIEKNDIDDKVIDIKDKVVDKSKEVKDSVDKFIKDNEIDKKVDTVKDNVISGTKKIKENVDEFIEKNDIDDKVIEIKDKVVDKSKEVKDSVDKIIKDKSNKTEDVEKTKTKRTRKRKNSKKKGSE